MLSTAPLFCISHHLKNHKFGDVFSFSKGPSHTIDVTGGLMYKSAGSLFRFPDAPRCLFLGTELTTHTKLYRERSLSSHACLFIVKHPASFSHAEGPRGALHGAWGPLSTAKSPTRSKRMKKKQNKNRDTK